MLALLDGDIYAYRCAAASENEPEDIAIFRLKDSIEQTLATVGATEYQVWLSDKRDNTFRRQLYPEYKANRTQPDPIHLSALKSFLLLEWGAGIAVGQEADDALGIEQSSREFGSTIICSIDKDLKQIPGRHYNYVRQEFDDVTELDGIRWFYKQLLIGDTADNIKGVYGLGPKKSSKVIDCLDDPVEMYKAVQDKYNDNERLHLNGKLVWIRRKPDELWEPPIGTDVVQN